MAGDYHVALHAGVKRGHRRRGVAGMHEHARQPNRHTAIQQNGLLPGQLIGGLLNRLSRLGWRAHAAGDFDFHETERFRLGNPKNRLCHPLFPPFADAGSLALNRLENGSPMMVLVGVLPLPSLAMASGRFPFWKANCSRNILLKQFAFQKGTCRFF